ncbi:MAG: hypothetical protein EXS31_06435 [Pedosphaera sp.]|nr:hypothetical protein [Pedosphaera sp.]
MAAANAVTAHWRGGFDEPALQAFALNLRRQLAQPVSLGLLFMAPRFFDNAGQILDIFRVHGEIPLLMGCSSSGLIAGAQEIEEDNGLVLGLYSLPGGALNARYFSQSDVDSAGSEEDWCLQTSVNPTETNGWLVFADPFHLDISGWLNSWNRSYPAVPVFGGLASGQPGEERTQLYLNGDVYEEGVIALSCGGLVALTGITSQGCTPIGEAWTITRTERNIIHSIGNRPAYEVLNETFASLQPVDQEKTQGNLFVGLVINEYLDEFRRGDFLVRNLIGADPSCGAIAIGEIPRVGQTLQFQRRDAEAASEDLLALLARVERDLDPERILGGCLFCCNGRGYRMFGHPSHDAKMIQENLGPIGLTGFFCNGEIGPVGGKNFIHGYTASLALFVRKQA